MMKEAKKAKIYSPEPGKYAALEEAKNSAADKVAAVSNRTMESYCED